MLAAIGVYSDTGANGRTTATRDRGQDRVGTELLALQTGSQASLRRRPGGRLKLTIARPNPRTLFFADSPDRGAQAAPVRRLPEWVRHRTAKQGHPPNLALSWHGRGGPRSLAATLRSISYSNGRLRATLDPLQVKSGAPAAVRGGPLGVEAFSDRAVSMVVDGSSLNRCYAEVHTFEGEFWSLESSSAERNIWDRSPPSTIAGEAIIGTESNSMWFGCEFTARYGDGNGNTLTIKVDNPLAGSAKFHCEVSGKTVCNSNTYYYDEYSEARLQAEIFVLR